jgi:hypothetical protein
VISTISDPDPWNIFARHSVLRPRRENVMENIRTGNELEWNRGRARVEEKEPVFLIDRETSGHFVRKQPGLKKSHG